MTRRSTQSDAGAQITTTAVRVLPAPILRLRLAALLAAQMFDFATFTFMVQRHGIRVELNPIVAHGFATFGLPLVALVKLALIVEVGAILIVLARTRSASSWPGRLATFVTVFAVAAGMVGGISNLLVR